MSHMIADSSEELECMRVALDLPKSALQKAGSKREHLDVCESKRREAIRLGAKEITPRQLVLLLQERTDPLTM